MPSRCARCGPRQPCFAPRTCRCSRRSASWPPSTTRSSARRPCAWEGEELTLQQLRRGAAKPRAGAARARLAAGSRAPAGRPRRRSTSCGGAFMHLRAPAGRRTPGSRITWTYRWQQMLRLDYTPQDCMQFQQAIEQVVVPAATRLYEKRRQTAGRGALRPWDLDRDLYPLDLPPLPAYGSLQDLPAKAEATFQPGRPAAGRLFPYHARGGPARPGQPQGQGARARTAPPTRC